MPRLPGRSAFSGPLGFVTAAAGVTGALALAAGRDSPAGPPREQLPDLVQRSPYRLDVDAVRASGRRRFLLGFASAVDNLGGGPLVIVGRRRGAAPTMTATQLVTRSDGSARALERVGDLRYTIETSHQHWHLLGFERYELRRAHDGRRVRADRKTGFCLGDRYDARPAERLAGEPAKAVWTHECGRNLRRLRTIREGISVGYGDDYDPHLEGQFVDITGLPSGRYELLHRVNAARALRESDYGNNAASVVVAITWPRGRARPPRVEVVARCGDGRRCVARR